MIQLMQNVNSNATQVKEEVYNICPPEEETPPPLAASTRESRVSQREAVRLEDSVQNRDATPMEVQLEAKLIQKKRELEELEEQLKSLQGINSERARLSTAGVCQSLMQEPPQKKRARCGGCGRKEAVVLNCKEQMEAALARQRLRQQQDSMKKAITTAKKELRAADKFFKEKLAAVQKHVDDIRKAMEKAMESAGKAHTCSRAGDKKAAAAASLVAQKQASGAHASTTSLEAAMEAVRAALLITESAEKTMQARETELKDLKEAAAALSVEERDEE